MIEWTEEDKQLLDRCVNGSYGDEDWKMYAMVADNAKNLEDLKWMW
jgi:hypothetical protein